MLNINDLRSLCDEEAVRRMRKPVKSYIMSRILHEANIMVPS